MSVLFMIESPRGHDEQLIPEGEVPTKVNEQVKDGNWATIEKKDGTTETITKEVPKEDWQKVFGKDGVDTKGVQVTGKMKGG